jgi:cobalt-zinc-cadmium efflux system membrane fusion protein
MPYPASRSAALLFRTAPLVLALALAACGKSAPVEAPAQTAPAKDGTIALTPAQIEHLGIKLASAQAAEAMPVGTVPGVISLPPEARVAVTRPCGHGAQGAGDPGPGRAAGRAAGRGARSRYGAIWRRAGAIAGRAAGGRRAGRAAGATGARGHHRPARADEARAALLATQATVAENRRLLALGGAGRDGTITLRAPIAGRVSTVSVDTGAAVGNGAAPFVVENAARSGLICKFPKGWRARWPPAWRCTSCRMGAAPRAACFPWRRRWTRPRGRWRPRPA